MKIIKARKEELQYAQVVNKMAYVRGNVMRNISDWNDVLIPSSYAARLLGRYSAAVITIISEALECDPIKLHEDIVKQIKPLL